MLNSHYIVKLSWNLKQLQMHGTPLVVIFSLGQGLVTLMCRKTEKHRSIRITDLSRWLLHLFSIINYFNIKISYTKFAFLLKLYDEKGCHTEGSKVFLECINCINFKNVDSMIMKNYFQQFSKSDPPLNKLTTLLKHDKMIILTTSQFIISRIFDHLVL